MNVTLYFVLIVVYIPHVLCLSSKIRVPVPT